eukprot:TRINITY_DN2128_c0_g1_i3.p1 TRINITY_DN2128_c0_g1~~TRINITY_DN2128_c0_g1_i3.p1  ORF type:complete len:574 (-),score=123.80 TRINITY_DN2128_c0_g1_i3:93-1814(-)
MPRKAGISYFPQAGEGGMSDSDKVPQFPKGDLEGIFRLRKELQGQVAARRTVIDVLEARIDEERPDHVRTFRATGASQRLRLDNVLHRSAAWQPTSSGAFQQQSRLAIERIIGGLRDSTSGVARASLAESAPSQLQPCDNALSLPKYRSFDDLPSAAQERRHASEVDVAESDAVSCPSTPGGSACSSLHSSSDLAIVDGTPDRRSLDRSSSDVSARHKPKLISDESQESFPLVYAMLRGIQDVVVESIVKRASCEEQLYKDTIVLLPEDFSSSYRFNYTTNAVQDEDHPESIKMQKHLFSFRFTDFAPFIFINMRSTFAFDTAEYLDSLTEQLLLYEVKSPGKSPSFFYFSHDYQFIIKTINREESTLFRAILPKFYQYIVHNPDTMLCKFFGLHSVQLHSGPMHDFVVMESAFPPEFTIHEKYDLKGSTVGRCATEEEKQDTDVILKDLDVRRVFKLGAAARKELMAQLERDTKFLEEQQVLDYSFLVGVHKIDATSPDISTIMNHTMFYQSEDGTEYFWFLIIDIFQEWNIRKRLENSIKSLWSDGSQISAVHPTLYRERFMKFLSGLIVD